MEEDKIDVQQDLDILNQYAELDDLNSTLSEKKPIELLQQIEQERSVLWNLIINSNNYDYDSLFIDEIFDLVSTEDFPHKTHQAIFSFLQVSRHLQNPININILDEEFRARSKLKGSDSIDFNELWSLQDKDKERQPVIEEYARRIRRRSILRRLEKASNDIYRLAYESSGKEIVEIIDDAEKVIFSLGDYKNNNKVQTHYSAGELVKIAKEDIESLRKNKDKIKGVTGLKTGFSSIDEVSSGLQPGDLIILAARPSMGKTAFALNICENIAFSQEKSKPVLFFSVEMGAGQLMSRMLSSQSGIPLQKIKIGDLSNKDMSDIMHAYNAIEAGGNSLFIEDASEITVIDIARMARAKYKEVGLSLIVIDYLQLIRSFNKEESKNIEIANISRSLKALAKELKIPVIALAQLSRSVEKRDNKRPVNSDLRDSGSIEQDADIIMMLYRDSVYKNSALNGEVDSNDQYASTPNNAKEAEIIITKNRNGSLGTKKFIFDGNISHFSEKELSATYSDHNENMMDL
ncbi:MAG: replicative DNA helicase [Psittacicella sp.]